jgi:hypothetical protein
VPDPSLASPRVTGASGTVGDEGEDDAERDVVRELGSER